MMDFRSLFAAVNYQGTDPVADGYLSFASDGAGGTRIYFDADGAASGPPSLITTLDLVPTTAQVDWFYH